MNSGTNAKTNVTKESFVEIISKYKSGDSQKIQEAKFLAIERLQKLMYSIINNHFSLYKKEYMPELMQEGAIGVLKGLQNYDPQVAAPSTYFYWFIKHQMQVFIDAMINNTSEYYSINIKKIKTAVLLINNYDMEYKEEKIAELANLPLKTVSKTLLMMYYSNEIKYDSFPESLTNSLAMSNNVSAEDIFLEKECGRITEKIITEVLNEQEEYVIRSLTGLNNFSECLKYKDIAQNLNVPVSRVRYIANVAIRKLRNSKLINYYEP